jgi:hypothetical protein
MSRRTSEASKAVKQAWKNEQSLVLDGKGTRNWTPEQQQSIIDNGKAYDEDGKAFEGHHMKSAETFPEHQGDAGNIEFLTRTEHTDAHGGSFHNATNGYYDPVTLTTTDFSEEKYIPCKIINLNDPIRQLGCTIQEDALTADTSSKAKRGTNVENAASSPKKEAPPHIDEPYKRSAATPPPKAAESFGNKIRQMVDAVSAYDKKHHVITGIAKWGGMATAIVAATVTVVSNSSSSSGGGESSSGGGGSTQSPSPDSHDSFNELLSQVKETVKGHPQHYHKKEGVVLINKDPYPRKKRSKKGA